MSKFRDLEVGKVGLIQQTDDGTIQQIGLTKSQSEMLHIFLGTISQEHPLIQMGKEYELVLKTDLS